MINEEHIPGISALIGSIASMLEQYDRSGSYALQSTTLVSSLAHWTGSFDTPLHVPQLLFAVGILGLDL